MKLEEPLRQSLAGAACTVEVTFPVRADDGRIQHFTACRVRHTSAFDIALGGLRLAPSVSVEQSAARAMLQSWSNALLELPFGGSAGGIACDPHRLSDSEKQRVVRGFARQWCATARHERELFAPDAGTNARTMAWWLDEIGDCGVADPGATVVGKPLALGGCELSEEAAGYGVMSVLRRFLATQHRSLADVKVAVQGFGHVGFHAARLLAKLGATIVSVSRSESAVFNEDGIDIDVAAAFSRENGTLVGLPGADELSPEEAMACECDVLIAAAAEGTLNEAIAPHVKARVVIEAAFGATTPGADAVLRDNGATVLPDVLSAAGSAVVGHLEWSRPRGQAPLDRRQVEELLQRRVERAFDAVNARADELDCDYRTAAYTLLLARVAEALRLRSRA
jgi:glutamate dehydrogenase/leucine dehydrogenase